MMTQTIINELIARRSSLGRSCKVFDTYDVDMFLRCVKWCVSANVDVIGVVTSRTSNDNRIQLRHLATYHRFNINISIIDNTIHLTQHVMHRPHTLICTTVDNDTVCIDGVNVCINDLPTLLTSDPVCMWYGFRAGDVVTCVGLDGVSQCAQVVKHDSIVQTGKLRSKHGL